MSTKARVTLTIEMDVRTLWGDACRLDQVYRQAAEEALGTLDTITKGISLRVIGAPKIEAIIVQEKLG